jgi:uncharacterized protein (DUF736 family)
MAITLGTFTKLDDGIFSGTLKTLNVTAALTIVPVDKMSDNAPDYRVYAGQRYEIGAGWSQVAKSSGETYLNLKIGAPEFGPSWVRCRSSSSTPPKTAPPTSPCGSRATANGDAPPRTIAAGLTLAFRGELGPEPHPVPVAASAVEAGQSYERRAARRAQGS